MVGRLLDLAFPDSDDPIATGGHVGILRAVKGHAPTLSCCGRGKLDGVAMPVIAIKLNNRVTRGREGIDAESVTNKVLALIWYANLVKQGVGSGLKIVWMHRKLLGVHPAQEYGTFWVGITAGKRAILDVLGAGR